MMKINQIIREKHQHQKKRRMRYHPPLFYRFFQIKKIPSDAPIRIIGANRTKNHSNA